MTRTIEITYKGKKYSIPESKWHLPFKQIIKQIEERYWLS